MDRRAPLYLMIWNDTYTQGWNADRSKAEAETAEHAQPRSCPTPGRPGPSRDS